MSRVVYTGKCKTPECNNQVPEGLVCTTCHNAMCEKWYNDEVEKMKVSNADGGARE